MTISILHEIKVLVGTLFEKNVGFCVVHVEEKKKEEEKNTREKHFSTSLVSGDLLSHDPL